MNHTAADDRQKVKQRKRERRLRFLRSLFGRKLVFGCAVIVLFFVVIAIAAPGLSPYDPNKMDTAQILQQPSTDHLLGTDNYGRDLATRLMYGTRVSLAIGVLVVFIACVIGTFLGMLAGYFGGAVDVVIMRFCEAIRSVPQVVFAMAFLAVFEPGFWPLAIVLGISNVPGYVRMMRAQTMKIKNSDYIVAAKLQGNGLMRLLYCHLFPNCVSPIIVMMTQQVGSTILAEAGLSFLGVGISIPTASWGCMVSDGKAFLLTSPLFALLPGLCVALLVIALNILGDGVRDALDPRLLREL